MLRELELAVIGAAQSIPASITTLGEWSLSLEAALATKQDSLYALATRAVLAQIEHDGVDAYQYGKALPPARTFRDAKCDSQFELAVKAVAGLGKLEPELLIYSHTSIDESVYQSTVCRLAARYGWSSISHFSLGQLQGASFFEALDLADSHLSAAANGKSVLFVASEKWPLPYPRVFPPNALYGDGAAAIVIAPRESGRMRITRLNILTEMPFLKETPEGFRWDQERSHTTAVKVIRELIDGIAIDLAIGSAPNLEIEYAVHCDAGLEKNRMSSLLPDDNGYYSAADLPLKLALFIQQFEQGKWPGVKHLLLWGIGVGGTVGAALLEILE